jgi:hypothetical protein
MKISEDQQELKHPFADLPISKPKYVELTEIKQSTNTSNEPRNLHKFDSNEALTITQ